MNKLGMMVSVSNNDTGLDWEYLTLFSNSVDMQNSTDESILLGLNNKCPAGLAKKHLLGAASLTSRAVWQNKAMGLVAVDVFVFQNTVKYKQTN